ncbi:MAG: 4'-phosphopantetheinyl transferase superfamily protein [Bacteroidales bacterium]|nr:4'-phosphopantetheinyl transferase superfamily protein [Bacteroidales bacterium]
MIKHINLHGTDIYIYPLPDDVDPLLAQCDEYVANEINNVASLKRRKEIVMSHVMIKRHIGENAKMFHDANGAPVVEGYDCNVSISHSVTEIVLAINQYHPIGVDLENWREKLKKVASRFLSEKELRQYDTPQKLLQAWTAKEALYKIAHSPGLSFVDDIILPELGDINMSAKVNTSCGLRTFSVYFIETDAMRCLALAHPCD